MEATIYKGKRYLTGTDDKGNTIISHELKEAEVEGDTSGIKHTIFVSIFKILGKTYRRAELVVISYQDLETEVITSSGNPLTFLEYSFQYCVEYLRKQEDEH